MSLFPREMESERLTYQYVHPDTLDALELYEHVSADAPAIDEITEYVTWDPHPHPRETAAFIEHCGQAFDDGEGVTYLLRPRDGEHAGEIAGMASLEVDWDRRAGTLGTWLRKPFWGRGYSGERAARLLDIAFDRLDLEVVAVTHDPDNENSRRAIERYVERFGGQREGRLRNHLVMGGEPRDAVRYSISQSEWRASTTE